MIKVKNFLDAFFGRPYRLNGTKIHLDAALSYREILEMPLLKLPLRFRLGTSFTCSKYNANNLLCNIIER